MSISRRLIAVHHDRTASIVGVTKSDGRVGTCAKVFGRAIVVMTTVIGTRPAHVRGGGIPSASAIAQAVEDHERAFQDIELRLRRTRLRLGEASPLTETAAWSSIQRFISRGNRVLARTDTRDGADGAGPRYRTDAVAFDGLTSREVLRRDRLKQGFAQDTLGQSPRMLRVKAEFPRPHVMLLQGVAAESSLSNYLRGAIALRRRDGGARTIVEGMPCITLELDRGDGSQARLWLAEEGDLIPARIEVYDRRISRSLPLIVAASAMWTAVDEEAVVPLRARVIRYDHAALASGIAHVEEIEELEIDELRLSPAYPVEVFQPPVPDGMRSRSDVGGAVTETIHGNIRPAEHDENGIGLSTLEKMLLVNNGLIAIYVLRSVYAVCVRRPRRPAENA